MAGGLSARLESDGGGAALSSRRPNAAPVPSLGLRLQGALARARTQGLAIVLIVLIAIFWATAPGFGTLYNLSETLRDLSILGILAIGETFVLIAGGIDLSVGSVLLLGGIVVDDLIRLNGFNAPLAVLIALGVGAVAGLINGIVITRLRISAFIVTLATLYIFRGVGLSLYRSDVHDLQGGLINDDNFLILGQSDVYRVPVSFLIFVALLLLGAFILRRTRFGVHLYAVGGNELATRLTGSVWAGCNCAPMSSLEFVQRSPASSWLRVCNRRAAGGGRRGVRCHRRCRHRRRKPLWRSRNNGRHADWRGADLRPRKGSDAHWCPFQLSILHAGRCYPDRGCLRRAQSTRAGSRATRSLRRPRTGPKPRRFNASGEAVAQIATDAPPALEAVNLGKSFLEIRAVDGVDFSVRPGEVHAIVGENGAGKARSSKCCPECSSLMPGKFRIDGKAVAIDSVAHGQDLGVAVIHQERATVPELTVAQNIMLGYEP